MNHLSNAKVQDAAHGMAASGMHAAEHAAEVARGAVNELRASIEPAIDQFASQAQRLAKRSFEAASHTGARAQEAVGRYGRATGRYVAEQPVKSVLIAAAAGAAIALLVAAARKRERDRHPTRY
jgi:ElaB/YqjD/DUF883 family membrane-anchored ribosome-binding protein